MEKIDVKEFIASFAEDEKVQELLKDLEKPESADELGAVIGQVAEKLGYDISAEDIKAALEEAEQACKAKTDGAAAQIRELPDEALDAVAGGRDHNDCKYSYKDKENCWFKDACDNAWPYYPDYLCKRHNLGT